ncbi:MAG: hypothetical protein RIS29_2697 [Bacteroidota bacterium]
MILSLLLPGFLFSASSVTVKGKITDTNNQPVQYATAQLINSKTNKLVQGKIADANGEFTLNDVIAGEYKLSVSMVGYAQETDSTITIAPKNTKTVEHKITLRELSHKLNAVEVTAKKKFIEQTVDKMVINPEASITTASENVYEILRKLPGVTVDNSDNISLKGKEGVKILIDDKPTYVSAAQLASMLKSMQGKNVDKIEIIENPSARYDAEGNSGIINIKTKHNKAPGFNGSVNGGLSQASKTGWNGGLDLNMNAGKFNVYGNYSIYNWAGTNTMDASRRFTSTSLEGAYQLINNNGNYSGHNHNYKMGADYYLKKNHVISAMFRGESGSNKDDNYSKTSFTNKYLQIDSSLITTSTGDNRWHNQTYNVNYKWDIDTLGQSLTADFDYATFGFDSPNQQAGDYYDSNGSKLNNALQVQTNQGNQIDIYTAKIDYVLPIGKKFNLESGTKMSFVNTDSHIEMTGYLTQADHFIYEENIQAAYVNGKLQLNKTTLQTGLRVENTISKGTSVTTNTVNDRSYLKFFPSFFAQQTLNKDNSINLNYSYRISRPGYHMLNPFKWMIDPYTYNVGNPNLKPQFTNSLSASHNYKNMLITSLGYSYTTDLFTEIIRQDDASKTVYQTMENLNNTVDCNASETFQLQPAKWWRMNGTITGMYKSVKFEDKSNLKRWSYMGNMSNNITLGWKLEAELSGNYQSDQLISNIIIRPRYSIDLGLQRKILNDKGLIKIALNDIFNTSCGSAYAKYGNVDIDVKNKWDSRRFNLSFNYRFGKDDFKTRSNRTTASSEEQSRSSK